MHAWSHARAKFPLVGGPGPAWPPLCSATADELITVYAKTKKKRNLISTRIQLEHQLGGLGLGFKSAVTIEPDIFRTQISFHFITFFFTKFHFITRKQ